MKKLCVVTGTRAEYGLLKPLIEKIHRDSSLELQLLVTGSHLSPEFGLTYKEIEKDGFTIDEKVEIVLSSDTSAAITKSMALALMGFGQCFDRLKPDMLIVLGDRYEIHAVATAAVVFKIPIAHLHGGEITEGAYDDIFRHSITKMSHLHFTSTEEYRKRVIQLGEEPERVFNVGAIGVENILKAQYLSREELEASIDFKLNKSYALITFHPETLSSASAEEEALSLLGALDRFPKLGLIFTKANSDTEGRVINKLIDEYVSRNKARARVFDSLGQLRYLSAMKYAAVVVGNSSSGIIEAPSLKVPTVNIGDRQRGRLQAQTVINCNAKEEEIAAAIEKALTPEFKEKALCSVNPYGSGETSGIIIEKIKDFLLNNRLKLQKSFYNLI